MGLMITAMRSITVGVSSVDAALQLFHGVMGLALEWRRPLPVVQARAWGLPEGAQGEWAELSCQGYPIGRLRLLALTPVPRETVRFDTQIGGPDSPLDIGPKAIDFYVRSPAEHAWRQLVAAGCIARSPPVRHVIGPVESEEAVLFGPDGVPLLIMVGHRHPDSQMRPGAPHGEYSEVPTISVVAGELERTRRFYGDLLGLTAAQDDETPAEFRDKVNQLVGIPAGSRVRFLLYQDPAEPSGKILLVHFGGASQRRLAGRMHPSRLGVALYTHGCSDLDALAARVRERGGAAGAQIVAGPVAAGERRTLLVRGPNEELFEFEQD
jgi:catechol 2,3-dioxygenase-like lactoylglutathione lyase family enzyme